MIRDAVPADLPLLAPIEASGDAMFVDAGHPEFASAGTISDDDAATAIAEGRIRVAEIDGTTVGWLLTSRFDGELFLHQVSVDAPHTHHGIGTALLLDCIERARAASEHSILLDTQADVPWNAPWYARHGFEPVPRKAWYASHGFEPVPRKAWSAPHGNSRRRTTSRRLRLVPSLLHAPAARAAIEQVRVTGR